MSPSLRLAFLFAMLPMALCGQTVTRVVFTPHVVAESETQPVRLEIEWQGTPRAVTLDTQNGRSLPMSDDGQKGDVKAGDGIWTLMLPAREVVALNKPERVFRPFLGYCKADGKPGRNIFASVWTPQIGVKPIRRIAADAQETEYVVNFAATRDQMKRPDARLWAKRFYETHADSFDFLNIVLIGSQYTGGFPGSVRNDIAGIGKPRQNDGAEYGSGSMLKGCALFPFSDSFDGGSRAFNREIASYWINHLKGSPFESGIPSWPKGDIAGHVIGIRGGGQFPFQFTQEKSGSFLVEAMPTAQSSSFHALELYLMGLLPAKDVRPCLLLKDQKANLKAGQRVIASDLIRVTIDQVIQACGPRMPDERLSQKHFRCATIILSESLLDPRSLSFYDYFARRSEGREPLPVAMGFSQRIERPWFAATGGRSTMTSRISGRP